MTIQSPPAWIWDHLNAASRRIGSAAPEEYWSGQTGGVDQSQSVLPVRQIDIGDVWDALAMGYADFQANRTDIAFLCFFYPVLGFILARLAFGYEFLPLIFPMASGFALVGPLAAVGLNEMSRRRERGEQVRWSDVFGVLRAPSIGAIAMLGIILMVIFLAWLAVADAIYLLTLGPLPPASLSAFAHDVFRTADGWKMIGLGAGIGFLFALLVLSISAISFPLLLDRQAGLGTAVRTSIRALRMNPVPMAAWGLIVAAGLALGSVPLFLGLVIALPVLGHGTWHLYRKLVPPQL